MTVGNVSWTFDTTRPDGGVIVDAINMDMPEYRPGATIPLELEFWESGTRSNGTGGTLGTSTGFTLGGANGATLGGGTATKSYIDRYLDVRRYSQYAGRASTNTAIDGTVHYRERLPTTADVDHIVVALRPSKDLRDEETKPIWVLLDNVDDATRYINDMARISMDATFLGTVEQYPDRSAIEAALSS